MLVGFFVYMFEKERSLADFDATFTRACQHFAEGLGVQSVRIANTEPPNTGPVPLPSAATVDYRVKVFLQQTFEHYVDMWANFLSCPPDKSILSHLMAEHPGHVPRVTEYRVYDTRETDCATVGGNMTDRILDLNDKATQLDTFFPVGSDHQIWEQFEKLLRTGQVTRLIPNLGKRKSHWSLV